MDKRGLNNTVRGERHHSARLDATTVRTMRRMYYEDDLCVRCICKLFDVNYTTGWDAINFNTWKHVHET